MADTERLLAVGGPLHGLVVDLDAGGNHSTVSIDQRTVTHHVYAAVRVIVQLPDRAGWYEVRVLSERTSVDPGELRDATAKGWAAGWRPVPIQRVDMTQDWQ